MAARRCVTAISAVVTATLMLAYTKGAAQVPDRETASALAIDAGRDTFRQFCAPCHGVNAKGQGPVAAALTATPADLTTARRRNKGAFPLAALESMLNATGVQPSAHGSGQMPIWGATFRNIEHSETLARARVANLLAYLESIQE